MSSSEEEHVCMEWACVKDWSDDPPLGKFRVLWAGHYDKVSQGQQIFVSNVRFTFVARRQHLGLGIPYHLYYIRTRRAAGRTWESFCTSMGGLHWSCHKVCMPERMAW